jgi:hypothetical protein
MSLLSRMTKRLTDAQKISRDADAITSGKPTHIVRRVKNRLVGRALAKAGFWKSLWR